MLIQSNSDRLSAVLEKVRIQHPNKKGEYFSPDKSTLDEVRSLLEHTESDGLNKLAFQFDPSKLLACVDIVASDRNGDTADKAAYVAALRPRDSLPIRCWFKIVASYPNPLLEKLLKELVGSLGYDALNQHHKISYHVPQWLLASELPIGILRDYQSSSEKDSIDHFLLSHFFDNDESIYSAVWLTLLTKGRAIDLIRQDPKRILAEMDSRQGASVRRLVGQHYLNTLNGLPDWSENILEYIKNKWGVPNRPSSKKRIDHRFWDHVSESAKEEFKRWLMLAEVESFFEGDRAEFWRDFVKAAKVKDVNQILSDEGFMLDFGHFGVVEFKNVGNAAYIYPKEVFKKFWKGANFWSNDPSYFKEISQTMRSNKLPGWDGRILHFRGWQSIAKDRINTLLEEK